VTTVCGAVPGWAVVACHANASGLDADRSMAGSTVENDSTLSRYFAPPPLKAANESLPSGGHGRMFGRLPR
jgi:hypothetical protein